MTIDWQSFWQFLELEEIQENIYRGASVDVNTGRVYGGQVFAQAIAAASQTVKPGRRLHSAHSYFLRFGDDREPIIFMLEKSRDGSTYSSRTVTALQKGRPIFTLACSFAEGEEAQMDFQPNSPFDHSTIAKMVEVDLASEHRNEVRSLYRAGNLGLWPITMRLLPPEGDEYRPNTLYGMKLSGLELAGEKPPTSALLGFLSDFGLLPSTMRAVGYDDRMQDVMLATICHSMWVQAEADLSDWVYVHTVPQVISSGRALVQGTVYNADGERIASLMQEGVARTKTPYMDTAPNASR